MDSDALEAAALLCRLVNAPDLLTWLGLSEGSTPEEARTALEKARKRMQAMQGNPKYKAASTHLLKSYRKLEELVGDPPAYRLAVATEKSASHLPLLELAIDGVLADGVLTPEEEAFVRDQAAKLGIADEVYERVLAERSALKGTAVPKRQAAQPAPAVATMGPTTGTFRIERNLNAAHRTAGSGWWDDAFTRLLLNFVPMDTKRAVDLFCGLGFSALALLPERPQLEYLGIDATGLQVDLAKRNLTEAGLGERVVLQVHEPSGLPVPSGAVDLVMCIMSLQNVRDTRPVFREAARLLEPGGRLLVVEPDSLGQQFWFDRSLLGFNDLFQGLCERVDEVIRDGSGTVEELGQPGIALGPELGRRMMAVGLEPEETVIHPVQIAQRTTFPAFARRLRRRIDAMREAGRLADADTAVVHAERALNKLEEEYDPNRLGTGVHLLPLFAVVGVKP